MLRETSQSSTRRRDLIECGCVESESRLWDLTLVTDTEEKSDYKQKHFSFLKVKEGEKKVKKDGKMRESEKIEN